MANSTIKRPSNTWVDVVSIGASAMTVSADDRTAIYAETPSSTHRRIIAAAFKSKANSSTDNYPALLLTCSLWFSEQRIYAVNETNAAITIPADTEIYIICTND